MTDWQHIKDSLLVVGVLIVLMIIVFPSPLRADTTSSLIEIRYCYDPENVPRTDSGRIKRSSTVLTHFKRIHPCPSTGLRTGSCPGWSMDHIIPMAVGGCDTVWNLQWLPNEIKSAAGEFPKDRWERKVYLK